MYSTYALLRFIPTAMLKEDMPEQAFMEFLKDEAKLMPLFEEFKKFGGGK